MQARLRAFSAARGWEQFHSPKNLSMALAVEAAELLEVFQWLTPQESERLQSSSEELARASDEVADVLIYLLQLADALNIDLAEAVERKLEKNAAKYPENVAGGKGAGPRGTTDA